LAAVILLLAGCSSGRYVPVTPDAVLIEKGDVALESKEYDKAVTLYRNLEEKFPESQYADDARFKVGFAYVCYKNPNMDYQKALREFKILVEKYPHSNWLYEANNWLRVMEMIVRYQTTVTQAPVVPPQPKDTTALKELASYKNKMVDLENKIAEITAANGTLQAENEKLKSVLKKLETLDK
jgi:outer membrane protein assembly factor BamD (BamD/ComL family)